jgi:adenylate cyclase
VCDAVLAQGFSLRRVQILILTQHPEVSSTVYTWRRDLGVQGQSFGHDIERSDAYRGSTIAMVQSTGRRVRVRLDDPDDRRRFPQLDPLAAEGMTDYIAEPLRFSDGRMSIATFTTDAPEGFTAEAVGLLDSVAPARRFPYAVFFDIEPQRLVVMAIAHSSRRPGYWGGRIKPPRRAPNNEEGP